MPAYENNHVLCRFVAKSMEVLYLLVSYFNRHINLRYPTYI